MTPNGTVPTKADLEAAGFKILLAVPLEKTLSAQVFPYFWQIAMRGWDFVDIGPGRTDVNRNRAARTLVNSDYTHLMMLDSDQLHALDIIERHARHVLLDPSKQVIAGLHFRRGEPFEPLAFVFGPEGELHPLAEWPQRLIEVHAVGHGSLLVHRSVFEMLPAPWWGYDYGRVDEGHYPTEDMYFCYMCRQAGIKLWVDTTITSPHLLETVVTEEWFRDWLNQHPEKVIG